MSKTHDELKLQAKETRVNGENVFVVKDFGLDDDVIYAGYCPICGMKLGNGMTSYYEGDEIRFSCGHIFIMKALVKELHLKAVSVAAGGGVVG